MHMAEGEIRAEYRQAKNPDKQLRVLAELNGCAVGEIKDIVKDVVVGGIVKAPRRKAVRYDWTGVDADLDKGMKIMDVAEKHGIDLKAVTNHKYRRGNAPKNPLADTLPAEPMPTPVTKAAPAEDATGTPPASTQDAPLLIPETAARLEHHLICDTLEHLDQLLGLMYKRTMSPQYATALMLLVRETVEGANP